MPVFCIKNTITLSRNLSINDVFDDATLLSTQCIIPLALISPKLLFSEKIAVHTRPLSYASSSCTPTFHQFILLFFSKVFCIRSGHILLNNFSYLMGKTSSSNCSPGNTREDVLNVLIECSRSKAKELQLGIKFDLTSKVIRAVNRTMQRFGPT